MCLKLSQVSVRQWALGFSLLELFILVRLDKKMGSEQTLKGSVKIYSVQTSPK